MVLWNLVHIKLLLCCYESGCFFDTSTHLAGEKAEKFIDQRCSESLVMKSNHNLLQRFRSEAGRLDGADETISSSAEAY